MAQHEKDNQVDIFDITDDFSGDLHETAQRNILVYANETDGKKEVPSILAAHDPAGSVHYLMGHQEAGQGPLRIPIDSDPIELKVSNYSGVLDLARFVPSNITFRFALLPSLGKLVD